MLDWETIVPLGQLVVTRGVAIKLSINDLCSAVVRHAMCDWGDLNERDRRANDQALRRGGGLLSRYTGSNGQVFWVITEPDRSFTTILLPNEY